ncbi:hypothetical protein D1872_263030 [compost metagenome]
MVEWPEEFKKWVHEKYDKEFLAWTRVQTLDDVEIEECKELIFENAKESLGKQGIDISKIKLEWVFMLSPYNLADPLDQSLMVCLKQEVPSNG